MKFAPRKIYGLEAKEGRKNRIGGEFSMQVPIGAISVEPTLNMEREWEYEKSSRFSVVGNFWSSRYGSSWDVYYWDIWENKHLKNGIPDRFNCGVIVDRGGMG